jgi:hypothetical protein
VSNHHARNVYVYNVFGDIYAQLLAVRLFPLAACLASILLLLLIALELIVEATFEVTHTPKYLRALKHVTLHTK